MPPRIASGRSKLIIALCGLLLFATSIIVNKRRNEMIEPPGDFPSPAMAPTSEPSPGVYIPATTATFEPYSKSVLSRTRIRSLGLIYDGTDLTIVSSSTVDGYVKPQRRPSKDNALYYQLSDLSGNILWIGSERDPRTIYYDYVDPKTGLLTGGSHQSSNTELFIRIPDFSQPLRLQAFDFTQSKKGILILEQLLD